MGKLIRSPEPRDLFLNPSFENFVIPRGCGIKSAPRIFAQVFQKFDRLYIESPWNGKAARSSSNR